LVILVSHLADAHPHSSDFELGSGVTILTWMINYTV